MSRDREENHSVFDCPECGAPMAHDQRYCVRCGTRRGGLPAHVAGLLGGIVERGRRVATPARPDAEPLVPQTHWYDSWVQAPRAAAVAVLSMLGFGVVVGSLVTGSVASPLEPGDRRRIPRQPGCQPARAPAPPRNTGNSGGGGGGVQDDHDHPGGGATALERQQR